MNQRLLHIIFALFLLSNLTSCLDDRLMDPSAVIEGETEFKATIYFERFINTNVGGDSRSAGDAIKEIENLRILFYEDDKLAHSFYSDATDDGKLVGDGMEGTVDQTGNDRRPNGDENTSAEERTPSANINLTLPAGKYKVFAVANMGPEFKPETGSSLDDLLSTQLTWTGTTEGISKNSNNQMLGYFNTDGTASPFAEAPTLTIDQAHVKDLYCWLRRAASKVTVAFDASDLEANVRIWLKSVQIKDIPTSCLLGKANTPKSEGELINNGEIIYYCPESDRDDEIFAPSTFEDDKTWPVITRGKIYGLTDPNNANKESYQLADFHDELSPALYFYENMQGEGKDKRQDADGKDGLDYPGLPGDKTYAKKDLKEYGTYIEVVAYYDRLGNKGKIIYRFMLGKNITTDYNAERNHHYKLTLKFNGYANDVDWHIEYRQSADIIVPNPYYISYLYNESVNLPIELQGNDLNNYYLKAEIIQNDWFPIDVRKDEKTGEYIETAVPSAPEVDNSKAKYYSKANASGPWYGFLSLAKNTLPTDDDGKKSDGVKVIGNHLEPGGYNKNEWFQTIWKEEKNNVQFLNTRIIKDFSIANHPDNIYGDYSVEKLSNNRIKIYLPYYTRQKQILPSSGYTGNNPYVAYRRKAVVKISLYEKVNEKDVLRKSENVTIYQVRRCVNPKGIWRSWDNDEEFHITMTILEDEDATEFKPYKSDGPWRAKVLVGQEWIKLNGKLNGVVEGERDTYMDFTYQPAGTLGSKDEVRCGIIEVQYNNYTCNHKIFVRQGYAPIVMEETVGSETKKIKWHTFNLYKENEETLSPLEAGSFFKFGNTKEGILASNNTTYPFKKKPGNGEFLLTNGTSKKWSEIKANTGYDLTELKAKPTPKICSFEDQTIDGAKCRVATATDYNTLMGDTLRQYGYGVLYGDGATTTATAIDDVYGYTRGGKSTKGMRGCFVYNTKTGNQLFFPLGAEGFGKRKSNAAWYGDGEDDSAGTLQYAWRNNYYGNTTQLALRPLFFDVWRRPGAMYWCNELTRESTTYYVDSIGADGNPVLGADGKPLQAARYNLTSMKAGNHYLDINYFTFEFITGTDEPFKGTTGKTATSQETGDSFAGYVRLVEEVK
ncbi:MAG: hypothetical protein NC212_03025 [Staphylococcus sp.]|nr:hypothetical protein [Staphylococcus sp.]